MGSRIFIVLIIMMYVIMSVNCRHLAPQQLTMALEQGGVVVGTRVGSSPPRCEHKCFGCSPCEAAQIPMTNGVCVNVSVEYSNYEPEGWKCKCGLSFYTP